MSLRIDRSHGSVGAGLRSTPVGKPQTGQGLPRSSAASRTGHSSVDAFHSQTSPGLREAMKNPQKLPNLPPKLPQHPATPPSGRGAASATAAANRTIAQPVSHRDPGSETLEGAKHLKAYDAKRGRDLLQQLRGDALGATGHLPRIVPPQPLIIGQ